MMVKTYEGMEDWEEWNAEGGGGRGCSKKKKRGE